MSAFRGKADMTLCGNPALSFVPEAVDGFARSQIDDGAFALPRKVAREAGANRESRSRIRQTTQAGTRRLNAHS